MDSDRGLKLKVSIAAFAPAKSRPAAFLDRIGLCCGLSKPSKFKDTAAGI
jgi:hypothetical protein